MLRHRTDQLQREECCISHQHIARRRGAHQDHLKNHGWTTGPHRPGQTGNHSDRMHQHRYEQKPRIPFLFLPSPASASSCFKCYSYLQAPYEMHEAARAGIRLMPDQGATIAGLRAKVAELEMRGRKLESTLRLEQQIKMLRRENARLREECSVPHQAQLKAEVTTLRSENAYLKSHNLQLAAKLHAAEKQLDALGADRN